MALRVRRNGRWNEAEANFREGEEGRTVCNGNVADGSHSHSASHGRAIDKRNGWHGQAMDPVEHFGQAFCIMDIFGMGHVGSLAHVI